MRWILAPTILVFVLGIVPTAHADDHNDCSVRSLQGSFGFTSTGTLLAIPAPFAGAFAEIGRQTFDGHGNTEGTATSTANGNLNHLTFQGSYTVNPDCTGSMTFHVDQLNADVPLDFVIDDDGAELRAVTTGGMTGNTETREYRKQFSKGKDK